MENPFHQDASEGYAWALLQEFGDTSVPNRLVLSRLIEAQDWMPRAKIHTLTNLAPHSVSLARTLINKNIRELIMVDPSAMEETWRLDPATFAQRRSDILGESLDPAIVRTILLTHRKLNFSAHPVLEKLETIFEKIQQTGSKKMPLSQKNLLALVALNGEAGYQPHQHGGVDSLNDQTMGRLLTRLQSARRLTIDGLTVYGSDFLTPHPHSNEDDRWRVATPNFIDLLGGPEAISDLKSQVLDEKGKFPVPLHYQVFEKTKTDPLPSPPPEKTAIELLHLDPKITYVITKQSERDAGYSTFQHATLHGDSLQILTAETDFTPYLKALSNLFNLPGDIEFVKKFLAQKGGPQKLIAFLSKDIKFPAEMVLVGFQKGAQRAGIMVVKANTLVPLQG